MLRERFAVLGAGKPLQPRIAVVVPIFKQGSLLPEALDSVMAQQAPFDITVILVNDGCPFPETHAICRDWAIAHSERAVYLRKANGGLSSARNAGIDFVLRHMPTVEAVYFLDSDNRLLPTALARAFAQFERHRDAAWIYPNIDMFGLQDAYDYTGDYSLIRHLNENICEAGSLVHRRVLEAGVRFDESMKSGYEDWDFWLSAAKKGFRGRCLPEFGFEYRRRPESMVAGSHRNHEAIRAYMRIKHKGLLKTSNLLREEHRRSPRYAVFLRDRRKFLFFTDPSSGIEEREFADAERLVWKGINEPARANLPAFLVATTSGFLALIRRSRLAPWLFWHLEDRLGDPHVSALEYTVSKDSDMVRFQDRASGAAGQGKKSVLAMMPWHLVEACVKDGATEWFDSIVGANPSPRIVVTELAVPGHTEAPPQGKGALESLQWVMNSLHHSRFRDGVISQWGWRNVSDFGRRPAALLVRQLSELDCPILPRIANPAKGKLDVAFVLPLMVFGGVEKIAIAVAGELKKRGFNPHLVISDVPEARLPPSVLGIFDSVSFLNEPPKENAKYFGTTTTSWSALSRDHSVQRAIGLLSGFDVVINAHAMNLNAIMGELRRRGVKTLAHEHVIDRTLAGGPCGHPYRAVAYEHAYDAVICESRSIRDWLHGMGVPYDKLIVVENAPSFPVPADECDAALRERAARSAGAPLNVLVLGRLDRQKGLHRAQALYARAKAAGLPLEWRVVGASVMKDGTELKLPQEVLYPAAFTTREIIEHLKWADVLLLLSSWEGLPLTVLEAMPFGVIPLCTDVGAIREAVEDGSTGFVVSIDNAVNEALDALRRLQADSALRARMAERASHAGRVRAWSTSVQALVRYLESLHQQGWSRHVGHEIDWWEKWIETKGLDWPQEYSARCDPMSELAPEITKYLGSPREITVLDVGSGPMTSLGKRWAGYPVHITACDALADEYRKFPYPPGQPLVPPVKCDSERLTEMFGGTAFDVVHARNTLDHGYDPMKAVTEMAKLVKPEGVVILEHLPREATHADHVGLHQFDFFIEGRRFLIEGAERCWDVFEELSGMVNVEVLEVLGGERCTVAFRCRPLDRQ